MNVAGSVIHSPTRQVYCCLIVMIVAKGMLMHITRHSVEKIRWIKRSVGNKSQVFGTVP